MIANLPETEQVWLKVFFSSPNGLTWEALENGSAREDQMDAVAPWIARLSAPASDTPLILPFYRGEQVSGWYATALTSEGEQGLRLALRAWLGPSYLTLLQSAADTNPSAIPMRERFGREVISFTGPEPDAIAARLALLARLGARRPRLARTEPRPVGRIRSDLERALLARDEADALALIAELRGTGRLNEENLQFLNVRLKAGLGQWEQIARDHWAIRNLSDLPLPPQTLSDLVEALYRVYIDDIEAATDPQVVLAAFKDDILGPFPRLFASRHGVRTPRVVKAFILYERLQPRPNDHILAALAALLPAEETAWAERFLHPGDLSPSPDVSSLVAPAPRTSGPVPETAAPEAPKASAPPIEALIPGVPTGGHTEISAPAPGPEAPVDEAETAFEDGQIDRAFEIDLSRPLHRKSLMRLLSCAQFIGTAEARSKLLEAFDAQPEIPPDLPEAQIQRVEALREKAPPADSDGPSPTNASGWLEWAQRLAAGQALEHFPSLPTRAGIHTGPRV